MIWQAWLTLATLLAVLILLATTTLAADVVLVAGVVVLLVAGVLTPEQAFAGFSNPGVITIAALLVVVAGLQDTGTTRILARYLLRRPRNLAHAQWQLMAPVTVLSAFVNNTPVVAALIPAVNDWCRRYGLSVSKLMMPLSFAAMLGGMGTLIGSSTNLLVASLMKEQGAGQLGMFELAWIGVPVALGGLGFILLTSGFLLPAREAAIDEFDNPREYSVEMQVDPDGPFPGQTIEEAGLRQLPGLYLAAIERDGQLLPAISPEHPLQANDSLQFVGVVDSVVDLRKMRGLTPAEGQVNRLEAPKRRRVLVEAVVSSSCPLLGQTIREGRFRSYYKAAVLAVARNGHRLQKKIGDIRLHAGDTLLLECRASFLDEQKHSRDFFLVSQLEDGTAPEYGKAVLASGVIALMVGAVTLGGLSILKAGLLAAAGMLVLRCCTLYSARKALDWPLFIAIAAAIGLAQAVDKTGLASGIARGVLSLTGSQPHINLAVLFVCTVITGAVVTNNAAAVIMFPVATAIAHSLDLAATPFIITLIIGASASFMTPIGYQTNLMIYGPGGYRFHDFIRLGLPLTILVGVMAVGLIPVIWPW